MAAFIGRKKELALLNRCIEKNTASLIVIKGRRRIGKSRLIEELAKGANFFSVAGLAPVEKVSAQHQRDAFAKALAQKFNMPLPNSDDWSDLFWHLGEKAKKGKIIVLFDEISWMGKGDPTFLGKLKNAWDQYFKKNDKLILILCGSVSSWIEKNILSSTGFVGRIDLTLNLGELTLPECDAFWGSKKEQTSAYEKFKILSVTGGIPRYLESVVYDESAESNIKRLCFTKESILYNEFDRIFHDLFSKRSDTYKAILLALIKNPRANLDHVFVSLNMKKSGVLSDYLNDLILSGFIKRDYTWSLRDGKASKLSQLRISDNYIRFYLKYIMPNKEKIDRDVFKEKSLSLLPGWQTIMGLQFENLVLQNRVEIQKILRIDPNEIVNEGAYFQRSTRLHPGCQMDYMVQTRFNHLYICEIKFFKEPIGVKMLRDVKSKIEKLALPKNFSYRPVLIHVNGVDDAVLSSEFFSNTIDFGALLSLSAE